MTEVLYKYRADSEFTEKIITSRKVFLATAHQLNDPFECTLQDICNDWMAEQIATEMQSALAGFYLAARRAIDEKSEFFGVPADEIEDVIRSVSGAENLEKSYNVYHSFILSRTGHPPSDVRSFYRKLDEQLTATGIFSLSADPSQALMWAHYADQHWGLCLGFRRATGSKLGSDEYCLPVIYSDVLPEMDPKGLQVSLAMAVDDAGRPYTSSMKLSFTDKTFRRVVSTKSTDWEYEQEFRYIEAFSGLCDWPGPLVECTFGLKCPEERRKHYISLLKANAPNEVFLFEMRRKHGTNQLERVPLKPDRIEGRGAPIRTLQAAEPGREFSARDFGMWMQQLLEKENYGEVIFQTGENLKRDPTSGMLLHLKATAHGLAHQHEEAYRIFEKLTELYPESAGGWYGLACALESMGELERVVELLRKAEHLAPNDPSIVLNLGSHLARNLDTYTEGITYLERAETLGHRRARQVINAIKQHHSDRKIT